MERARSTRAPRPRPDRRAALHARWRRLAARVRLVGACLLLPSCAAGTTERGGANGAAAPPAPSHPEPAGGARPIRWESVGPGGGGSLQAIAVHPADPDTLFLACDMGTIWRTRDGGRTYESLQSRIAATTGRNSGSLFVNDWAWSAAEPRLLFGCGRAVIASADLGESWRWTSLERPGDSRVARRIALDPRDPQTLYLGLQSNGKAGTSILKSTDGGRSFSPSGDLAAGGGTVAARVEGLIVDPADPAHLLANTIAGIFGSDDAGRSWRLLLPVWGSAEIEWAPSGDRGIFTTGAIAGPAQGPGSRGVILRSRDGGRTWEDCTGNLAAFGDPRRGAPKPAYLAVDPVDPRIIHLGTGLNFPKGFYTTRDGGASWERVADAYHRDIANRGHLYGPPLDWPMWANDVDLCPASPATVYWADNGVFQSRDGVAADRRGIYTDEVAPGRYRTRGLEPTGVGRVAFDAADSALLYAGWIDLGLLTSRDGGESWQIARRPDLAHCWDVVADPGNPGHLYVTSYAAGGEPAVVHVLHSTDGGATWTDLNGLGLPEVPAQKAVRQPLLLEPGAAGAAPLLYLALQGHHTYGAAAGEDRCGFWVCEAGRWEQRNAGLPVPAPHIGALARAGPGSIWAGVNGPQGTGQGPYLCHTPDGGRSWEVHRLAGLAAGYVTAIALDPGAPGTVHVAVSRNTYIFRQVSERRDGLFKTTDGGRSWRRILGPGPVEAVALDPADPATVVAGIRGLWNVTGEDLPAGIYVSRDAGRQWSSHTSGLPDAEFRAIAFDPHHPGRLYVSTFGGGLFRGSLPAVALQ